MPFPPDPLLERTPPVPLAELGAQLVARIAELSAGQPSPSQLETLLGLGDQLALVLLVESCSRS
jgi:hypothetical protein